MIDFKKINKVKWNNTKIAILGAGKSGYSASKLALSLGAKVLISDNKCTNLIKTKNLEIENGGHTKKILDSDLIIKSPGIPDKIQIINESKKLNIPLVSEIEFSSWFTNSPILAITGSNGKTTTTSLLHQIVKSAGYNAMIGGNIGVPFAKNVLNEKQFKLQNVVHVLELSSFQLENIKLFKPLISMILNISPDHMDRYESQKDYLKAKLNIAKNLVPPAWLVFNADDSVLKTSLRDRHRTQFFSLSSNQQVKYQVENNKVFFNKNNKKTILFRLDELSLMGNHNLENIIAAATAANLFGIKNDIIKNKIIDFQQLEHRMEIVKSPFPLEFINDSKATNIASTIAAIKSFKNITLILGGQDKGNTDFAEISKFLKNRVNQIISYGKSGQKICKQLEEFVPITFIRDFSDAINKSIEISKQHSTILLSPGCSSFDQFSSYEKRGDCFKK